MKIRVFYDNIKFRLNKSGRIKEFLIKVITDEKKIPGDLSFIFTDNNHIIEINRKYLRHDYYTDVIAFDYSEEEIVNGEIYISIDTVRSNAERYNVSVKEETVRVMIHGTLHLCGYDDRNESDRKTMFGKQEESLRTFFGKWNSDTI